MISEILRPTAAFTIFSNLPIQSVCFNSIHGQFIVEHLFGKKCLSKCCCCDIGQELFDLFIRNRLSDKVHFFRIVYILKITELFPEELLVVIGAEKVF
jgi:hypothetical protein